MNEVSWELKEHIGVLSTAPTGWSKELNVVALNGKPEKYDIREWCNNHTRMRKGMTLNAEEARRLRDLLNEINFEEAAKS